ncbi:electron transport complex subunit RsxE [Chromatiales bacterium (ex Bugula neritina AB1)]|nr:electron transport complex subunit RsxE [Chromatiales bacterium (ex Bugula neritina AB1)]
MTNKPSQVLNKLLIDGLWKNNPALVQLLGLCPLLAVSNSAVNGLGLGLATIATLVISNSCVSATRRWLISEIRIPVFVLLIAGIVTSIGMLMNAVTHQLYQNLGIFIPLIITNCTILARAETYASRNRVLPAAIDGLAMGAGFALVLFILGAIRELIGTGHLFANAEQLFGPVAGNWQWTLSSDYPGLLVAILPPGAFILLSLLLAAKNIIEHRRARPVAAGNATDPAYQEQTR